jgi:sugar phosphate isomerase/epimerase
MTTRRTFLRTAALTAAAIQLRPAFARPAEPAIKLGLASYTFRNFSRAQLIGFVKQLDLTGLNPKDAKDHLPMPADEEAKALADYAAAGIHLHAAGVVYFPRDEDDDIRSKFEYAKRAGVPIIVAGDPALATLPRLERFVREYNIKIAIHNHGPEDKVFPSPLDVLKAVNSMDPRMGCCIDVGHCVRAGTDVVQAIHAAGPRLFNMHMKDLTDFTNKDSQVAVGEGKMPIRDIFAALIETKYPGWVDLEYEIKPDDPMPGVTKSFAFMRGVAAALAHKP